MALPGHQRTLTFPHLYCGAGGGEKSTDQVHENVRERVK